MQISFLKNYQSERRNRADSHFITTPISKQNKENIPPSPDFKLKLASKKTSLERRLDDKFGKLER